MNDFQKHLLEQLQKVLNPTGPSTSPPNLTPIPGTEKEQHKHEEHHPHHEKKAAIGNFLGKLAPAGSQLGEHLAKHDHLYDLAGLGILAAPSAVEVAHELHKPKEERQGMGKALTEIGGLGVLAAPVAAQAMGFGKHANAFFDELEKIGFVSDREASHALNQLDDLETNKPTAGQLGGYAAIGALSAPAIRVMGNLVSKGQPFTAPMSELGRMGALRELASQAAQGAVAGGAVPIVQQEFDRHSKMKVLKNWVKEHEQAPSEMAKAAAAVYLDEVQSWLADEGFTKTASAGDLEELQKLALSLAGIRGGIANVAGKISPTLNKPVMQAAQQGAHALQSSNNSFVQGMGNVLHHKAQTPGKMLLGAANPVGTAAEVVAGGAGNAAAKGLSAAGGALQNRFGTNDAVVQQGRAMTPMGRLQNAAGSFGQRMQQTFSPGGAGHNVMTKHIPQAAEIGGAVGAGLALHAPVGLAGAIGKGVMAGAGKVAPAVGALAQHAPAAVQGAMGAVGGALKGGAGQALGHLAEDVIGTGKQNLLARGAGRVLGGAARTMGHSIVPAAGHAVASMIPAAPAVPHF